MPACDLECFFMSFYFLYLFFSLNPGPMFKRKLQVSSSTFALKNTVRDKWAQQSHPAEDCSSRTCPTDAACDPWTQSAACGKVPHSESYPLVSFVMWWCLSHLQNITCSLKANFSSYTGTWHKYQSWLWFIYDTLEPWHEPCCLRHAPQHPSPCSREPTCHGPEFLFFFIFFPLTEAAAYRQTRGSYAPQGVI